MKKYVVPIILLIVFTLGYFGIKSYTNNADTESINPVIGYEQKHYDNLYTKPSRESNQGCEWKEITIEEQNIKFLAQDCAEKNYSFKTRENLLYLLDNEEDISENSIKVFEIFEKEAETDIVDAITNDFYLKLTAEEQEICQVTGKTQLELEFPKENYSITLTEEIQESDGQKELGNKPCGYYGQDSDQITYFEYHPTEDETRYMYVVVDTNNQIVDENSFVLIPTDKDKNETDQEDTEE